MMKEKLVVKNIPLRISKSLFNDIASWAKDDFRSINGQIEYLLSECVKQRKKDGKYVSKNLDPVMDLEFLNNQKKK